MPQISQHRLMMQVFARLEPRNEVNTVELGLIDQGQNPLGAGHLIDLTEDLFDLQVFLLREILPCVIDAVDLSFVEEIPEKLRKSAAPLEELFQELVGNL